MPDKEKGPSASAWLSLRTELARTLQKTVTLAALAFLDSRRGDHVDLSVNEGGGLERPASIRVFVFDGSGKLLLLGNPVYINFR
jgi:hypothetical protein